jgi:hypothetical protein
MRRADLDGPIRYVLEHLRVVGEKDVARRHRVARQPGHVDIAEQSREARFEAADELVASADEGEQGTAQSVSFGGLQFRPQGGRCAAAVSRIGRVDYVEMHPAGSATAT